MGLLDKAKELAAKAEQAVSSLDSSPNPNKEAEPLFRDLGAKTFEREQGRADDAMLADIANILERLRTLEASVPGGRLATGGTTTGPPPPGAAAAATAAAPVAPPPGAVAPPPPPGAVAPPPPPGAVAPPPPPGTV